MDKLIIDILVGLPGSGRTTWLKNNNTESNTFDNIGDNDPDLQRFRNVVADPKVKRISISEVQFADITVLFKTLTLLHETIESVGRDEEYNFILFPQSEAYCIRNIESHPNSSIKIALIRNLSSTITQTFILLKNKFPRFIQEIRIAPVMHMNKNENLDTSEFYLHKASLDNEPTFDPNMEPVLEATGEISEETQIKKKVFSISNFLRKST